MQGKSDARISLLHIPSRANIETPKRTGNRSLVTRAFGKSLTGKKEQQNATKLNLEDLW